MCVLRKYLNVLGANNKFQFGRPMAAQKAASILGTTVEELSRTLFAPAPQITRSPARCGSTLFHCHLRSTTCRKEVEAQVIIALIQKMHVPRPVSLF